MARIPHLSRPKTLARRPPRPSLITPHPSPYLLSLTSLPHYLFTRYGFVFDAASTYYKMFLHKLAQAQADASSAKSARAAPGEAPSHSANGNGSTESGRKRRRKRWDVGADAGSSPAVADGSARAASMVTDVAARAAAAINAQIMVESESRGSTSSHAAIQRQFTDHAGAGGGGSSSSSSSSSIASGAAGSVPTFVDTQDVERQKQLALQKEMQLLEERTRGFQQSGRGGGAGGGAGGGKEAEAARLRALHEKRLDEYSQFDAHDKDEPKDDLDMARDGVILGGTWEHRKRAHEMMRTADGAFDATVSGKGKHFMGDFLPKGELDKFMKKADAIAKGETYVEEADFEKSKLTASNKGFQMMQGAGWAEGQGLGAAAQGQVAPVNMSGSGGETTGLGVKKVSSYTVPHRLRHRMGGGGGGRGGAIFVAAHSFRGCGRV